jgi:hypothetical protein
MNVVVAGRTSSVDEVAAGVGFAGAAGAWASAAVENARHAAPRMKPRTEVVIRLYLPRY